LTLALEKMALRAEPTLRPVAQLALEATSVCRLAQQVLAAVVPLLRVLVVQAAPSL
jgi:hypothetical protein